MKAVFRREMADYLTGARVLILLTLAIATSMLAMLSVGYIRFSGSSEFVFLQLFTARADDIPTFLLFLNFTALFFIP